MTILKIAGVLVALLVIAPATAFACHCDTYGEPRKDAKEYYTKKFDGAIFTGTVTSIRHDPKYDQGGITDSELTIRVDQHWLGVTKPTMVLRVHGPYSTCWFNWKVGDERFFIAVRWKGIFYDAFCDRANWMPSNSDLSLEEYTTKLLDKPKSFPKPK
jgi:hypothetical protein